MAIGTTGLYTAGVLEMGRLFIFLEINFHGMAGSTEFRTVGVMKKRGQSGEGNSADKEYNQADTHSPCGWAFRHNVTQ